VGERIHPLEPEVCAEHLRIVDESVAAAGGGGRRMRRALGPALV
jgi:hypothetical protein